MAELMTTPSGIWVLQAMLGVETMPTSLRLRPYIPSIDSGPAVATVVGERPLAQTAEYASLQAAGVIDTDGRVDDAVRDWMAVIGRPQREVVVVIRRPAHRDGDETEGVVQERTMSICQRERWLAMIARSDDAVVVAPIGETPIPDHQIELICDAVVYAFGDAEPAAMDGVNVPTEALQSALLASHGGDRHAVATGLARLGLSPDQVAVVASGIRIDESAMAVVSVVDHGATPRVHPTVVTVVDTAYGRVSVTYTTGPDGSTWTSIWPTSEGALRQDLANLLTSAPLIG